MRKHLKPRTDPGRPSREDQGVVVGVNDKTVRGKITDFIVSKNDFEKEGEIVVREKVNPSNRTLPLKAFACSSRRVTVGIYLIFDSDKPGTDEPDDPEEGGEPWIDSSDENVVDLLNEVYQKQAGVTFERDPSSQKVDLKGTGAYNENGEVEFDISQQGLNGALGDIANKVAEEVGEANLPKLRVYLVKRMAEISGENYVGVNILNHCFANRFEAPITVAHEVGHAFDLSTEGKGQGAKHDEGPWPDELKGDPGLMAEDGYTKWLRREDWKVATKNAGNYE